MRGIDRLVAAPVADHGEATTVILPPRATPSHCDPMLSNAPWVGRVVVLLPLFFRGYRLHPAYVRTVSFLFTYTSWYHMSAYVEDLRFEEAPTNLQINTWYRTKYGELEIYAIFKKNLEIRMIFGDSFGIVLAFFYRNGSFRVCGEISRLSNFTWERQVENARYTCYILSIGTWYTTADVESREASRRPLEEAYKPSLCVMHQAWNPCTLGWRSWHS